MMEKQMSFDIDAGLNKRLKDYCIKKGLIKKFVVSQAIEGYLDKHGN